MTDFAKIEWLPRNGVSSDAVDRMRSHTTMPSYPMGEAWFLGERKYYPELSEPNAVLALDWLKLTEVITEISGGTSSFGKNDEWDDWFKFMLPDLIYRSLEDQYFNTYILQPVVTAFMAIYWQGITEEYPGYRGDIFSSLFQVIMDEPLWDERLRPVFLRDYENGRGEPVLGWNQAEADANVSAMMMFGLKYLEPTEIPNWVNSILAIEDIHWRGNFLVWLLGAYDRIKSGYLNPASFDDLTPHISWDNSNVLDPDRFFDTEERPFIEPRNGAAFTAEIERIFTYDLLVEWADSFGSDYLVGLSTHGVPDALHNKLQAYRP